MIIYENGNAITRMITPKTCHLIILIPTVNSEEYNICRTSGEKIRIPTAPIVETNTPSSIC